MKKITDLFIVMGLFISLFSIPSYRVDAESTELSDIGVIKERLKSHFLTLDTIDDGAKVETILVSEASKHLASMSEDGSWDDVDYAAKDNAANGKPWSPYLALDRMQALAIAYWEKDNVLYKDPAVIDAIDKSLTHWAKEKPSSTNWWENDIGVNLRFSRIGLFLENELSESSMNTIINNLNKEGIYQGTGQNNLWYDQNAIYRALITNDGKQLKKVIEECLEYVLILQTDNITQEALQVDNSLYFHGVQFYSNGYGLSMFRDMSFWIYMLNDTAFELSEAVVERMGDYMLDGTIWTLRTDIMELYLGYRPYKYDVGFDNYAAEYIEPLERMVDVDKERSTQYKEVLDNLQGKRKDNGLSGNNYMWRVGYGSHMREGYGVNIKMDSKRIIGGEWRGSWPSGKDGGNSVIWSASASSSIIVDGDEYTPIYPTFDWAHVPGVTSPNFVPQNYSNYGRVNNNDDHALGVSDGTYGSTAYTLNKSNTQGNKSYFFFNDEFVAMGSNIKSTGDSPVHTTLNQSKSDQVIVDGEVIPKGTKDKKVNASWVFNDNIAYIFPKETALTVNNYIQDKPSLWPQEDIDKTPETFSAWIDHGVKPKAESYEYIVLPNTTVDDTKAYAKDNQIEIIENSENVHAVRHNGLKITQINFFKEGSVEYAPGKTITVDKAVNLIIDESKGETVVSLAMTDTSYNETVKVIFNEGKDVKTSDIILYPAPYTGKTISFVPGLSNEVIASSQKAEHPASMAFDGKKETYWESTEDKTAWIQKSLGNPKYINSLEIDWGKNPATKYKIQVSLDGHTFFDINTNSVEEDGKIKLNEIASYIRIVLQENNEKTYTIAEVDLDFGTNIALNKKVNASSVSTNDPGNIPTNINDGNISSRWSSLRNSDKESVVIDLGGDAKISAVNIHWEAARSAQYELEISNNKLDWTSIGSVGSTDELMDSFTFDEKVEGRYIRVNSTKSKTPKYGISIFEIEVYGTVELKDETRVNLAFNKDSKASSEFKNKYTGFVHESNFAFDQSKVDNGDKFQSRWASERDSADEWIQVDLGKSYLIDEVVLDWEGAHASEYKILVSEDDQNWTEVFHTTNGKGGEFEIEIEPVEARYVKMQGIQYATKYGYSLWEFEVYGEEIAPVNVALFKPTRSSSNFINPKSKFELKSDYAVDGSTESRGDAFQSRWVSKRESANEWMDIDLESNHRIDKITLNWEGAFGKEYYIQVSNNGVDWINVIHETHGREGIIEYELEDVHGTFVRMQGVQYATKYGYSLWEFEVYGKAVLDPVTNVETLENQIEKYNQLVKAHYTHKEFDILTSFVEQAEKLLSDLTSTQKDIDSISNKIAAQMLKLELNEDTELKELIESINVLQEGDFTKSTFETLQTALEVASDLIKEGAQTNEEYIVVYDQLLLAYEALVDIAKLNDYISFIETKDASLYTEESYEAVLKNMKLSKELIMNDLATQDDVDTMLLELQDSVSKLEFIEDSLEVDTSQIDALLLKAKLFDENDYTKISFVKLNDMIEIIETYLSYDDKTQVQIDYYEIQLQEAIDGLISKALYIDDLIELLDKTLGIDLDMYTGESIAHYKSAKEYAVSVLKEAELNNNTQVEIDKAYKILSDAIDNLVEKEIIDTPDEPDVPNTPDVPEDTDEPISPDKELPNNNKPVDKLPTTGSSNILVYAAPLFIVVGILLVIKKKKINN